MPDLYFKVVDPKLQVADLKAEVGKLRSGGIPPNLTPDSVTAKITTVSTYFAIKYIVRIIAVFADKNTPVLFNYKFLIVNRFGLFLAQLHSIKPATNVCLFFSTPLCKRVEQSTCIAPCMVYKPVKALRHGSHSLICKEHNVCCSLDGASTD